VKCQLNVLLVSSFFDSKCLVILQECATAQNELLKEFLEKIQARKKEVNISAVLFALIRYGDGAGNTVEENSSVSSPIRMR